MRIKVTVSYTWEFDQKQWSDTKDHWDKVKEELNTKILFDPVNMFYHMRDIEYPSVSSVLIEEVKK